VVKPTGFAEDAAGYQKLFELLARAGARGGADLPLALASAQPQRTLVVMEATGNYWQNLLAALMAEGYAVALVNPLCTHDLPAKNWRGPRPIASTACRSPASARRNGRRRPLLPDAAAAELRELVRLRTRLTQEVVDRVNQLHRLIDFGFPRVHALWICQEFRVWASG
jgi:transposase